MSSNAAKILGPPYLAPRLHAGGNETVHFCWVECVSVMVLMTVDLIVMVVAVKAQFRERN